ncbi:hypothetical protein KFL_005240080 [Klebsormidium nitens]|uniref:Uncharacterized protein n=1 Tax=Klebsormidium nitens TaxID=105231 RepID=A0A1Y1IMV3_KLENI|nr:hypothetical protein KFL_005240080 [Klebsormidium nitens]|eukprot:GAQ89448.1 hypothetical protein KFL_005240080 [Klebsormidium nitens]
MSNLAPNHSQLTGYSTGDRDDPFCALETSRQAFELAPSGPLCRELTWSPAGNTRGAPLKTWTYRQRGGVSTSSSAAIQRCAQPGCWDSNIGNTAKLHIQDLRCQFRATLSPLPY